MTFLMQQSRYIDRIDQALHTYFNADGIPPQLLESMSYSVFAGGKRLRPCLTLAACELVGGSAEDALPFACALEMIHTYSLIHDDLPAMDNDDFRRGRPTSHKVFGEGQAVLAGDGLLSYAFEILLNVSVLRGNPQYLHAAAAIAKGAGVRGMVAGQCLDLLYEGKTDADKSVLHAIHRGKTGAMIKAAVESGAFCANADADALSALREFGAQYGLLFQITDDILDVVGDAESLGKTTGKDAQAGKLTFPAIYGVKGAVENAAQAAEAARAALVPFGEDARFFRELIDYTLTRKK